MAAGPLGPPNCESLLTALIQPGAVVVAHAGGDRAHQRTLGFTHEGAPDVENQHGARDVAVVPRLVLDRVVEYKGLPWMPLALFGADPEAAAGRDDQRQMYDEARVADACMRRDPRPGIENGEQGRRRGTRHIAAR